MKAIEATISSVLVCLVAGVLTTNLPGPPRDVEVSIVNSTTILVKWKEPRYSNGMILGYSIVVSSLNQRPPLETCFGDICREGKLIRNLKPDTKYSVGVFAINRHGEGRESDLVNIITAEKQETRPDRPPRDLRYEQSVDGSHQVQLYWDSPKKSEQGEREIGFYVLKYKVSGALDGEIQLEFIKPNKWGIESYKKTVNSQHPTTVWVAAANKDGTGPFSNSITINPENGCVNRYCTLSCRYRKSDQFIKGNCVERQCVCST